MITQEQINSLICDKEVKEFKSLNKHPNETLTLLKAKDGKIFAFDGSEVFYYSDGKELFARQMEQKFELLKSLVE